MYWKIQLATLPTKKTSLYSLSPTFSDIGIEEECATDLFAKYLLMKIDNCYKVRFTIAFIARINQGMLNALFFIPHYCMALFPHILNIASLLQSDFLPLDEENDEYKSEC